MAEASLTFSGLRQVGGKSAVCVWPLPCTLGLSTTRSLRETGPLPAKGSRYSGAYARFIQPHQEFGSSARELVPGREMGADVRRAPDNYPRQAATIMARVGVGQDF